MGRFSLGFAFFALAGAFFPCFGRDFFFFFFGFLGAFGSWDSGDSWGSAGAGSAAGSAAGSSRWEGCQPLVSVASGAGCSAGSSTGSGAGAVSGSCCTGLFFFLGFFCFCFWACGKRGSPGRLPRRLPRPRSTAWQRRYPPARLRVPAHSAGFEGSYFLPSWGILLPCVLTQLSIIAKIYGFVQPGAFGWSQGRTADAASIPPWAWDFLLLL